MRNLALALFGALVGLISLMTSATPAVADITVLDGRVWVKSERSERSQAGSTSRTRHEVPAKTTKSITTNKKRVVNYRVNLAAQQVCVYEYSTASTNGDAAGCTPIAKPDLDDISGVDPDVLRAAFDPEDIAYIAFAQMTLVAPKPHVGPPPSINTWKMAAVGYPLWLWADGQDPAPVSDRVFGLYVSLDAHVEQITYSMGDGSTVTCTGRGRAWHRGVEAGTASPTCGYRYQKPSRPNRGYTITARTLWAVDWSVTGTTGTISFVQVTTTTLPVGELQVLVR